MRQAQIASTEAAQRDHKPAVGLQTAPRSPSISPNGQRPPPVAVGRGALREAIPSRRRGAAAASPRRGAGREIAYPRARCGFNVSRNPPSSSPLSPCPPPPPWCRSRAGVPPRPRGGVGADLQGMPIWGHGIPCTSGQYKATLMYLPIISINSFFAF